MSNRIILDTNEINIAKNFYAKCLSLGFVKVQRDNEQDITILRVTDTRFEHYLDALPFKVGSICFISPKVSSNALAVLNKVSNLDYNISKVILIRNKYLKIKIITDKNKKIKFKFKLWTINFK